MKVPVVATILTLCGAAVLFSLGYWQLQRLVWKQGVLDKLRHVYSIDASAHDLFPDLAAVEGLDGWARGSLSGEYLLDKFLLIGPRTEDGEAGYHLLVPLRVRRDGREHYVLVNRGWVEQGAEINEKGNVPITVTALAQAVPEANSFVPENVPEQEDWFRYDLEQMAEARNVPRFLPAVVFAEDENPPLTIEEEGKTYPVSAALKPDLPNNHLQYAIFWFAMGFILCVFYVLRFFVYRNE